MGRGASPLRGMVRASPKKPGQENMDAHCVSSGDLTPTRKPLSSISEACRNSDENNGNDALTPKGKADGATSKGKKRGGQCLFPLGENLEGGGERHGHGKNKKPHGRHQSPLRSQPASRMQDGCAVEAGTDALSAPVAAGVASRGMPEHQGLPKQVPESANSHTPRAHRNERLMKQGPDSEPIPSVRPSCNQAISATPAKSVTRTLKYGAAQGAAAAVSSTSRALVPLPGGGRNVSQGASEQQFHLEEDPSFWLDHNVQVLIRTRPINSSEMVSQGFSKCLRQESPHTLTWLGPPEARFTFDHVAGEIISQEKLFSVAGLPMVENCMAGYNSCMFAYGQTGSGKTHTMLGDIEHLGDRPSDNRGMTPRVFEYLFSRIQLEEEQRKDEKLKFLTKCSFLEIYNEQITDLLEPTSTNLQMREDVRKGVYVENLTEVEVNSVEDVIQLLSQGSSNRKVAATNMNRESSRSHSVFTCIIESRWERDSMTNIRFGRLNLVDLAGSERQKSSGAEGERLKEAANINKSLSTLGLVIMILVDVANGKQRHVPYRDSKLTFLLQDSLGGNSKTTIIATVSPSSCNALETLSTLKFAQRAKLIRNTAVINEDASGDVKALRAQIQQMKEELDRLRRQSISRIPLSHDDFNSVRGSFEAWGDANKFFGSPQVSSRKLRQMETVVAGALRREQAADATTKRLASEIEQLNRLVHQREADTQSSKMVLRFREDKIRRLETLSKGLLSVDSYLSDEKKMLMEELELTREKAERNPELIRFAMENIRLLDQIRSLEEFHEGGERDVMREEMSNLRDQLLEVLDGKIAVDQGLVPLTTPQKKALAPELVAAARENELLRLEADNYRAEVEELRRNLSSSLESYSKMGRQVDDLQEVIEKLKVELAAKGDSPEPSSMTALEVENLKHLELLAELKLQLEQSAEKSRMQESVREQLDMQLQDSLVEVQELRSELEATKESFEAARALTMKLQSKEAALVGASQYAEAVKQIRLETEEMAAQQNQSLTNIQEMAVVFRTKEVELRAELDDALEVIQKLSAKEEERKLISAPSSMRADDGSFERLQKAQEIEMRHAEEVMQLQMELESLEAVLDEERAQKKELEEKLGQFEIDGVPPLVCARQGKRPSQELEMTAAVVDEEISLRQDVEAKVATLTQQLQEAEVMISNLKAAGEVRETTYFDAVSRLQLYSPDPKSTRLHEQLDQEKVVMEALENQHLYSIREFEALLGEHAKALEKLKRREERERILRRRIGRLEHELEKEQEVRELEREYAGLEEDSKAEKLVLDQKLENAKRELEVTRAENLKLKEEESEKDLTRCQAESETVLAITSMQAELSDLRAEGEVADRELAAAKGTVSELTRELASVRMMLSDVKGENLQVAEKYESMLGVKDSEIEALRKDRQSAAVELIDYLADGDQALNKAWLEMEQISSGYVPSSARSSLDCMSYSRTNEKRKAVEHLKQLQHAQELAKDAEGGVRVLSETAAEAIEVLQCEVDSWRQKIVDLHRNATVMSVLTVWLSESVEKKEIAASTVRAELRGAELVINEKERLLSEVRTAQEADQCLLRESEEKVRQLSEHLEETKRTSGEGEAALAQLGSEVARLQSALESLESERKQLVESKEKVESDASETRSAMSEMEAEVASTRSLLKEAEDKAGEAAAAQESLAVVKEEWEAEKAGLESGLQRLETEKSTLEAEMEALRVELEEVQARSEKLNNLVLEKASAVAALESESKSLSCMSVAKEEERLSAHEAEVELLRSGLRQKEAVLKQVESDHLESVRASEAREKEREREIAELREQSASLLLESRARTDEAAAALEAVSGEKAALESRLESASMESGEAAARLCEAEEAHSILLEKVSVMEARIVEYEEREQSLMMEVEELSTARNMSEEDVIQLQCEVVELRRERDCLNSEVSTMDAQSAISEKLQFIQSMCLDTDNRIVSMQSELEDLISAKETLETECRSIEASAVELSLKVAEREECVAAARKELERVQMELTDVTEKSCAPREELAASKWKLESAEESIAIMSETIDELRKSRAGKEEEYGLLQERLEGARVKRTEAQEKLDALTVAMHEFSRSEESWRSERDRIVSEIEETRFQLAEKGAEVAALQEEKRALEIRLLDVAGQKDAALATIASLENRSDKFEAVGKCAGKDSSSASDEVELAKARAALAGAEEKVKLLVDANATMAVEWEGERSRLNADKELLQLEISRLEKPADSVSDETGCSAEDGGSGKGQMLDELKQVVKRTSADCEKLRCKLRERDNTILSVKLQLEEAMVHYKETEIEMEKTIREREDAISRIAELEAEVTDAHEEIVRRREQVETFELELENVVVRVTDSEAQWRSEREQLESERDDARAEAVEVERELREQLKRERDASRSVADEPAAALRKRIEETRNPPAEETGRGPESCREVEESVSLSLESMAAFALAKEEVDLTKKHCEKEMETLAGDMKSLRADISGSFFEFPVVEIHDDVNSIIEAHRTEIARFARKVEVLESAVVESRSKISTLEAALENAQEVVQKSLGEGQCVDSANSEQVADLASACADLENTRVELEMSEAAVSQLLAAVSERDATLSALESAMKETQERLAEIEAEREATRQELDSAKLALLDVEQLRSQVLGLQRQVAQKEELIKGFEYDINLLEEAGAVEAENAAKSIAELQKELDEKREEVRRLNDRSDSLESALRGKLGDSGSATGPEAENANLRATVTGLEAQLASLDAVAKEKDSVVMSLKSELEAGRSVMESERRLKKRVADLEEQLDGLEKNVEDQCHLREQIEKELRNSRQHGSTFTALESMEPEAAKRSLERQLRAVEAELSMAHQRREILQSQCDEKDRQIKSLNGRITQATSAAGRQTAESHQKVKGLEALMENGSGKSLSRTSSMGPCMDLRNADAAARRRIEELEALAAGRQKEVYGLNAKVAELESDLHDVVRGLVRINLDAENMKLNHPQVKEIVANARRQSLENQRPVGQKDVPDAEVERLRKKLNEFIEERDSWLEEITRQQAEIVAARASADKMRCRDESLTAENEQLKTQSAGLLKRLGELEQEIKKLSGQQNLQQRIHHHAKIKDENNSLRLQVEDLNTKMRRAEMVSGRVRADLERYRRAAGKTPFPDIDEEQRLRSKLQEAEESKIQLAQKFITLSNAIQLAAGNSSSVRQVDESAAMDAVRKLESRLRTAEDEASEFRLKTRISGEKRRLSELRTFHTPVKSNPAAASQQFLSSPATYR